MARAGVKPLWARRARADLRKQFDHIAQDSADAAFLVEGRVLEAVARLVDYPEIGRIGRAAGTRELPVRQTSLLIVYEIDVEVVRILHVRHMARRPTRAIRERKSGEPL